MQATTQFLDSFFYHYQTAEYVICVDVVWFWIALLKCMGGVLDVSLLHCKSLC